MYGMLLESVQHFIQAEYGEEVWFRVVEEADCRFTVFATHTVYPDSLMTRLAESCARVVGPPTTTEAFMHFFGRCFVRFFSNFGYDEMIKATGRHFCDFLESVNNIHLQMRFTYHKMKSPSMYISHVDKEGVVLVYRSGRQGFTQYLIGQLEQISDEIYGIALKTQVLEETISEKQVMVRFRLDFNNAAYVAEQHSKNMRLKDFPLPEFECFILLELFPFGIMFDKNMKLIGAGEKISALLGPRILGLHVMSLFRLRRPKGILFSWSNFLNLQTVLFELEVIRPSGGVAGEKRNSITDSSQLGRRGSQGVRSVLLKGQMKLIKDINAIIYLCSPLVNNLEELPGMGLFLNDLNVHGLSRELVLTGWQHGSRLELKFERAEQYSVELEKSYADRDGWRQKGDELLYSMIPKPIADRLRHGENAVSTCQAFEKVTILFCELAEGDSHTLKDAMDLVRSIDDVFSCFDKLVDLFDVFKVETVGRVYMAVSGAPDVDEKHADHVADLALSFLNQMHNLHPEIRNLRIGIHSGPVVAGVVGLKVPRYCLFGDTVNTAARMQTTSKTGMAHLSKSTFDSLTPGLYQTESRGKVKIKGKGMMETYWLIEKNIPVTPVVENSKTPVTRCSSSELPKGQTTRATLKRSFSSELKLKNISPARKSIDSVEEKI